MDDEGIQPSTKGVEYLRSAALQRIGTELGVEAEAATGRWRRWGLRRPAGVAACSPELGD